jgi:hypothetical protein
MPPEPSSAVAVYEPMVVPSRVSGSSAKGAP